MVTADMVLILAVEPDSLAAANIAKMLRARPQTEVVIAGSAAEALHTLGDRLPDMLLVSPRISRLDEAMLKEWLQYLGPAAARMRQLTIPMLVGSDPLPSSLEEDLWVPIGLDGAREEPAPVARPTPAQDEWGFFDPAQCGFAALLTKLDDITKDKDVPSKSADTTVRVVKY